MSLKTVTISCIFLVAGSFVQAQDTFDMQSPTREEVSLQNKVELFPNPAVDYLVVQINSTELRNTQIELRSMIGNRMKIDIEKIDSNRYRIPLKDFATGYYFLVVKDEFARFKQAYKFLKR